MKSIVPLLTLFSLVLSAWSQAVKIATFEVDATPPLGSPLAYDPVKDFDEPLSCRGVVIAGKGKPMVICAVDWIGIGSGGQTEFKAGLAAAAGTTPDRVAVHTLHQHDAPRCNFTADKMLEPYGISGAAFNPVHARKVIRDAAAAIRSALKDASIATHYGLGRGIAEKVASNRRILGPDGKVQYIRYTATRSPKIRAFPAGTIDPELKMITFWNEDRCLAAITWYATHPQSYYRTGLPTPDFPGLARNDRQVATGVPHIHFNGAGGNVGAGKWNDGSKKNRKILTDRVAAGMTKAWENTEKHPLAAADLNWGVVPVVLPRAEHMDRNKLRATLADPKAKASTRFFAAKNLDWFERCQRGDTIDISCLSVGRARVLHLPGELFVEYQLNAQKLRPDLFVAMAAYGDYSPGYIGTKIAYSQGGYETSPGASKTSPKVEGVLMGAVKKLLNAPTVLKGDPRQSEDENRLVAALEQMKQSGGEVVLDGGIWIIRREVRLPSNLILRATNNAVLRLPTPRRVAKTTPIGAKQIEVDNPSEFRTGGELAILPPGESKERIATVRLASVSKRMLQLAKPLTAAVPKGSRIGYSHRMFLGYAVTNVSLRNLIIDGGRDASIPMPGHHLRSAIWISAPYNYEKGPTGPPAANISVSNCTITNCYGRAVAYYHTVDSEVTNCRIGGLKDEGIDFDHFAFRCRAVDNEIDGATIGVELNDASDCQVLRNRIHNTHIGVRIWWYDKFDPKGLNTRNHIKANHITSASRAAIYLGRNCTENRILRNKVAGKIEADRKLNEVKHNTTP